MQALRILLIDDNPDDRALIARELRKEFGDIFLREIRNAPELLDALNSDFDLVITDYQLRWTDGLTVLRQFKLLHPSRPVIMFTGTGSEEIAVQAMKEGLEDYVLKSEKHYTRLAAAVRSTIERINADSRAQDLQDRLDGLLNRLKVGVFRARADGFIIEANPAFLELLGWHDLPRETHLRELYFRPEIFADHWHQLHQQGELREHQVELCRANGASILVAISETQSVGSDGEKVVEGLVEDISYRLESETQIRQAQKLESVGRLAAGVAHDFNNILTIIHGYTALLSAKNFDADTTFSLKNIASAAERAATLTRQLLAFSRRQAMQVETLDLIELLHGLASLLKHVLGDNVSFTLDCPPGVPSVRGDSAMLGQIVMNLAMNARDAMPSGGSFTVATNSVEIDRNYVRNHREARPGNFVCMTVSDTGTGIAPENLRHLFEPFFTTKEVGKGTGLGLAAVYGIIKQHKGWIDVHSQLGRGTTFQIFLPVDSKIVHAMPSYNKTRSGSETVLLVEDEPELLDLVREILQSSGYHVLPASSGKKALEMWRDSSQEIDLLLTDMKMPDGIGGLELAQLLIADNPRLKVLYTSGFSPDHIEPRVNLREGVNFVQKPFPPEKLLATIRHVLEPS